MIRRHFLFLLTSAATVRIRNWQPLFFSLTGRKCTLWPWRRSVSIRLSSPSTDASWAPFWTSAVNCCTRPSDATWRRRATRGSTTSSITSPTVTSWRPYMGPRRFTALTYRGSAMASTRCLTRATSDLCLPCHHQPSLPLLSLYKISFFFCKMTIMNISVFTCWFVCRQHWKSLC